MNSYTERSTHLEHHRNRLESLIGRSEYITAYHPKHLGTLLNKVGASVMQWLTTGSMPHISKEVNGDNEVWKVYDPISNQTRRFDHENALRVWMEERYYQ